MEIQKCIVMQKKFVENIRKYYVHVQGFFCEEEGFYTIKAFQLVK
jgi:hypothetical protein